MLRLIKGMAVFIMVGVFFGLYWKSAALKSERDSACAYVNVTGIEALVYARENGLTVNEHYNCIDKNSYLRMEQNRAQQLAEQNALRSTPVETPPEQRLTLSEARKNFQTKVFQEIQPRLPLPTPPAVLFVRSDYTSGQDLILPAFVTPDPKDGKKHPAIIWLTGGDSNSLDDFWTVGPASHDESASQFRDAAIVMMYPTLRGGNMNPGKKEFLYGEIDDVLAAAEHLAQLSYVDPKHIYLGGHSTGGTLALLTAESSPRFAAVFAFGAVGEVDHYPASLKPNGTQIGDSMEIKMRSPIHWLQGIGSATYLFEGVESPSNIEDFTLICKKNSNPQLHCFPIDGTNHFSVLPKVARVIAAKLSMCTYGVPFELRPDTFQDRSGVTKQ